jgi:hypothetical protein
VCLRLSLRLACVILVRSVWCHRIHHIQLF